MMWGVGAMICIGFLISSILWYRSSESTPTVQPRPPDPVDSLAEPAINPPNEGVPSRAFRLSQEERQHLIEKNPFQISAVPPAPAPPPATPPPTPPTRQPPSPHRLVLVGTIFSTEGGYAIIRDEYNGAEGFFPPGQAINERATLVRVERNEAVVRIDERDEKLSIAWNGDRAPTTDASPRVASGDSQRPTEPPSVLSTATEVTSVAIARDDLDQNFRNLSQLLTQMRVQPYFQDGKPSGFLISSVSRGSFVERLGARSGDVIREVNGRPIDSVRTAFELYNTFRNDDSVSITITRGGQPQVLDFAVQ